MKLLSGNAIVVQAAIAKKIQEWEEEGEIMILSSSPGIFVNAMFDFIKSIAPYPNPEFFSGDEPKIIMQLSNKELNLLLHLLIEMPRLCHPLELITLTGWSKEEISNMYLKLKKMGDDLDMDFF